MIAFFRNKYNLVFLALFAVGIFLRVFDPAERFMFTHDQDLASWIVKDIVVNKHLRLIGQETSTQGVFIGPLYYYLLIPFYLLFKMDPLGSVLLGVLLGAFGIFSFYFCFSKIFDKKIGLVAAALYAFSFYAVVNDREIVPTMPVITWTAWFFYGLYLLLNNNQYRAFIILGILGGLVWNLNMALIILVPLIPLSWILSKSRLRLKALTSGMGAFFITSLPLIVFELRHNFGQLNATLFSLSTNQRDIISGTDKFMRVIHFVAKNFSGFFWRDFPRVEYSVAAIILLALFVYLIIKKMADRRILLLIGTWAAIYIFFFSLYSKIVSEYYLNGMLICGIATAAVALGNMLNKKGSGAAVALGILAFLSFYNIYKFFSMDINKNGYIQRKQIVAEIKADSLKHKYPCVAVSYITDPGYELGYRYLFWLAGLHVNYPKSLSPVYTIVYPLKPIFPENKAFGAIGLIYPDYAKYTAVAVEKSCSGRDSNSIDSMFGYTQ